MKIGKETRKVEVVTYADEDVYVLELNRDEFEILAHAVNVIGDRDDVKRVTGISVDELAISLNKMINARWNHVRQPHREVPSILGLA